MLLRLMANHGYRQRPPSDDSGPKDNGNMGKRIYCMANKKTKGSKQFYILEALPRTCKVLVSEAIMRYENLFSVIYCGKESIVSEMVRRLRLSHSERLIVTQRNIQARPKLRNIAHEISSITVSKIV